MIKVAMIGFGGIAQGAHLKPHIELEKNGVSKLVAVCDIMPERFGEKMEINIGGSDLSLNSDVKKYTDWHEMLKNEDVDVVDICVPTYLHADIAIEVLESGHHVICEKPMSLTYEQCKKMYETANRVGKRLMIGHSVRFNSCYACVKNIIDSKKYGKVKSAVFQRLSPPPVWGWDNWYMDYNRSRGCILDLHIHDIDFIRYTFGEPQSVSCCTQDIYAGKDIVHSRLMYDDFSVMAIGDWSRDGLAFEFAVSVALEDATVVIKGSEVIVHPRGGEEYKPAVENINSHQAEIMSFMDCIANNKENTVITPESAALTVKLVNTLMESSEKNGEFIKFCAE